MHAVCIVIWVLCLVSPLLLTGKRDKGECEMLTYPCNSLQPSPGSTIPFSSSNGLSLTNIRHRKRGAGGILIRPHSTSSPHTYIPLFLFPFFLYYSLSQLHLYISGPELINNTTTNSTTNLIPLINHAPPSRNSHRRGFLPTFLPRKATTPSKAPIRSILPPRRPNPPSTHPFSRRSFKLLLIRRQRRVLRRRR